MSIRVYLPIRHIKMLKLRAIGTISFYLYYS